MKLQEMINMYLEYCEYRKELDWNTLKAYRIDLRQFIEFIEEEEPSKEKIERYITYLHKKYKQKTVKRKIASLKVFYAYLEEEEIIEENPMRVTGNRNINTLVMHNCNTFTNIVCTEATNISTLCI